MNDPEKKPIQWEMDFDDTNLKELERKLFAGEISFEEWDAFIEKDVEKRLARL